MQQLVLLFLVFSLLIAPAHADEVFGRALADAGLESANADITYNGAYRSLDYPWGDVPADQGVCTDVVIRAYRALDVDLQQRVHRDMLAAFAEYPSARVWGLARPDRNIDHRRVLNLEVFFTRAGARKSLPRGGGPNPAHFQAGDVVTWRVPRYGGGTTPHMGLVTDRRASDGTPLVVHHLSGQPKLENVLFAWRITGHFRYHVAEDQRDR